MRTVFRLVRRYVTAAFAIVLTIFTVSTALFAGLVIYFGIKGYAPPSQLSVLADSFTLGADGQPVPQPAQPLDAYGFEWAMLLSDSGEVRWRYNLPEQLDRRYTLSQAAAFSRWYLDDYPIFVYRNAYGLLVSGMPRGSITRFNFYIQSDMLRALLRGFGPMLLLDLALILLACLLLAWRAARSLRGVAAGIAQLARGEDVRLPERGIAAELAAQLNQTSALLQTQAARLARRDSARTQWIAGVSHDIRTPLSLIYLHAEELAADGALTDAQRARARVIGAQGQKIRALIEDLNLTSKLQYGAQPLRRARLNAGALLRQSLADFCNDPLSARCPAALSLSPEAERAFIWGDAALLRRAMDNLLGNSARHNPQGCAVQAEAQVKGGRLIVRIRDDGAGYPPAVLSLLHAPQEGEPADGLDAPHILGLHLVRQIADAHGGSARFFNHQGACCEIALPIEAAAE